MADQDDYRIPVTGDVSDLLAAFDQAGEAAEQLGSKIASGADEGSAALEELGEGAEESGEGFEGLGEKMEEHTEQVGRALSGWQGLLGVIGGGAAAEAMAKVAETTMELGDSLRKTSETLNVSVSDARGFNEAMSSLGVSSQAAAMAIRRLEVDAVSGGKKLAEIGISAKEANGGLKDGITIFQEVIDKLSGISDPGTRSAVALQLLGRSGAQLLGVLDQVNPAIEKNMEEQEKNTEANANAVEQSKLLHEVLTQLNSAWEDATVAISPIVVAALQAISEAVKEVTSGIQGLISALNGLVHFDFGAVAAGLSQAGLNATGLKGPPIISAIGGANTPLASGDMYHDQVDSVAQLSTGLEQVKATQTQITASAAAYCADVDRAANYTKDTQVNLPQAKGKKGAKEPDMTGLDDALTVADSKMADLATKFSKMGSEAQMAAKEGGQSFDQLRAQATAAYQDMQAKYKVFLDTFNSGNKQATQQADTAWKLSAEKFAQDWQQASEKAKQDMQQVKQQADQLASEVSGVLNNAISGHLNWAQEFDKILEKMLSSLIKHLFQQIALWAQNGAQVNAIKATSGEEGLAIQKQQNMQAGTSDAVTAAKGAYASAAQIPYIGWIVAPMAAAAAFAGVEAFGSAEGGFDIPPGVNPVTQLHAKEMVLPANLAEGVRNMSGQGGQGGGGDTHIHQNVQAWDGRSVMDTFLNNGRTIGTAVRQAYRGGMRHSY
jgi:hypothetical protein